MSGRPGSFSETAALPVAGAAELLVAAAAEFGPLDAARVERGLDRLVAALLRTLPRGDEPVQDAEALLGVFRGHGFRATESVAPRDALLPAVLDRRAGHPVLLAAVGAEVGRRAGVEAAAVETAGGHLVGVRTGDRAVVIDPAGGRPSAPGRVRWLCAHEVAFAALAELSRLFALHGRIPEAIRAAGMRAALPVADHIRERIEFEVCSLRAQLN